ncbi:MAG: cation:proton antiporter [Candidatus Hydrogenedentes bacterium]|nr:cation:proton antiporter [Candidatus Hydrogenedentota bacterium]
MAQRLVTMSRLVHCAIGALAGCFVACVARAEDAMPHGSAAVSASTLFHVLLAIAVIIVVTRAAGMLVGFLGQPLVMGEVIGGIVLGPSLLGRIAPETMDYVLPAGVAPFLGVIAQLGVILYMFLVGLELDLHLARRGVKATVFISNASIAAPFILGAGLAFPLHERFAPEGVGLTVFVLFLGVSMSITAFPVLARILADRRVQKTRLGVIALTCAAIGDATAWCLLAFVVSFAHDRAGDALQTLLLTIGFVALIVGVGTPLAQRWVPRMERRPQGALTVVFVAMLLSAVATEYIGIHAIFGAFLLGAIIPHDSRIASDLTHRLESFIGVLFLPVFFAYTGMRTQIGLISGVENWLFCGAIIAVACMGKFGGTYAAARLTGMPRREASALGVLMNTRGLVELIVLNIGLDLGVISPTLFAMLVLMALVTTFMTSPLLNLVMGKRSWGQEDGG